VGLGEVGEQPWVRRLPCQRRACGDAGGRVVELCERAEDLAASSGETLTVGTPRPRPMASAICRKWHALFGDADPAAALVAETGIAIFKNAFECRLATISGRRRLGRRTPR